MDKELQEEIQKEEQMLKRGEESSKTAEIIHDKAEKNRKKREFRNRRFKKIMLGFSIAASLTAIGIISYKKGYGDGKKASAEEEAETDYDEIFSIETAPDDLLVEWAFAVKNQNISDDEIRTNAKNVLDSYLDYYNSTLNTMDDLVLQNAGIDNSSEDKYNEFKNQVMSLESNLSNSYNYKGFSFENSLYSKSIVENDLVYIPYNGSIDNISDSVKIINVNGKNKLFTLSTYNYMAGIRNNTEEKGYSK